MDVLPARKNLRIVRRKNRARSLELKAPNQQRLVPAAQWLHHQTIIANHQHELTSHAKPVDAFRASDIKICIRLTDPPM